MTAKFSKKKKKTRITLKTFPVASVPSKFGMPTEFLVSRMPVVSTGMLQRLGVRVLLAL